MKKTLVILLLSVIIYSCTKPTTQVVTLEDGISLLLQPNGPTLGISESSGVTTLTVDGFFFKDLNKNGQLDAYEDWRLSTDERARNLASIMTVEQIAGLMLYSSHQSIPATSRGFGSGTYGGKPFDESGMPAYALSDQQKKFLEEDNLRHVLITSVPNANAAARWNNLLQAYVEGLGVGIPANNSSDPRHGAVASTEFNAGAGGAISMWPESIGLAATFDPEVVQNFGRIASIEYRALGLTTALSPQIDLGTDPRWNRMQGTFGEDPLLSTDMARAYIDGFQSSASGKEIADGWGFQSVNAMVKHWPGGGTGEGGRDAHFSYGKFAVYPGNNFEDHLKPFLNGAFELSGKTRQASAVMPYYTISHGIDKTYNKNIGNGFSDYIIKDLLREKYGYDGVVCTDWLITANEGEQPEQFRGKPWGVEELTVAERHFVALMAGVDQFGGNNDKVPVLEAYAMGVEKFGEEWMRNRMEQSAVRLLRNIFRTGLFENPYIDPKESEAVVGNPEFMAAGFEAQRKSVVLLKNEGKVLPLAQKTKVYLPNRLVPSVTNWWGFTNEEKWIDALNKSLAARYLELVETPEEADVALIVVSDPKTGSGYDPKYRENGGNGYAPISLQYRPYTADFARKQSLAAGDPVIAPTVTNRSYHGKKVTAANEKELDLILDTKKQMGDKPVVVVVSATNPLVVGEFESQVQGLLLHFGVQDQAILDILTGQVAPNGLLPFQMPANMKTVEEQHEDAPHDMQCHVDSQGNRYDFAFGLNWEGVIEDQRASKYRKSK